MSLSKKKTLLCPKSKSETCCSLQSTSEDALQDIITQHMESVEEEEASGFLF